MHYVPRYTLSLVRDGSVKWDAYPRFSNSRDIFLKFKDELNALDAEVFFILTLDTKNKLIGVSRVSVGSLNGSLVHPREVWKRALLENAACVIFLHNHPSGDPTPSREDRETTSRLWKCGKLLGIRVLDHIIIGEQDYFSFADSCELADHE